jgi:hypothetical protein
MSWKIEDRNGQFVIVHSNGAVRAATEVEVDMWAAQKLMTKEKTEMVELLNDFALKCGALVLRHTGKAPAVREAPKVSTTTLLAAKKEEKKAEAIPAAPSTSAFGKREETSTKSLKERMMEKHGDKLKSSSSSAAAAALSGPVGKLPG